MELISKEELINKINAYMVTTPDVTMVRKLIDELPIIKVVNCKDCFHGSHISGKLWACMFRGEGVNENGYCHKAELRSEISGAKMEEEQ